MRISRRAALRIFVVLFCSYGLLACDGKEQKAGSVLAVPEKADIGESIEAEGWRITLLGPSEKIRMVGRGNIVYQAEGVFVIVPVEVVNTNDEMALMESGDLGFPIKVEDVRGREFRAQKGGVHVAYEKAHGNVEILFDSPIPAGHSREGAIIFDVAKDSTDLQMTIGEEADTLRLGF